MAVPTDPSELQDAAKCWLNCGNAGMLPAVQTMLLAQIAGGSTDPAVLMDQAKCFFACIPPGMQKSVQSYLLVQIANKP